MTPGKPSRFAAAQSRGLIPILCVGEQLPERESGRCYDVVGRQLEAVVALTGIASFGHAVVAYEPVWAIGTGLTPTVGDVEQIHSFIRGVLTVRFNDEGKAIRILYGGSVKPSNAAELMLVANVNGALIGGASLKAGDFLAIAKCCS